MHAGGLASSGQIRVNQSLVGAPQAFTNATINLNRPAAAQGPKYIFVAGSQICIPSFYSASATARTTADAQAAAAPGRMLPSPCLYTAQSNAWVLTVHEGRTMQPLIWHLTVSVHFLQSL